MDNLEAKHEHRINKFVEMHCSAENEERFLKYCPYICNSEIDLTKIDLHPPVAALLI